MIKEIFNIIKNYAEEHQVIKSFNFGDTFNIEKTGEDSYPQIYLEFPFSIKYFKNYKEISFAYYIIEQPNEINDDEIELINKIEILNDILIMKLDLFDFEEFNSIESSDSITLTEWMGDKTVAIRTDITLKINRDLNLCLDPIKNN